MNKAYYATHRSELLAKKKAYDLAHKSEILKREKARYLKNRERIIANVKRYTSAHRDAALARTKKWHRDNPARSKAAKHHSKAKRRAIEYATRINEAGIREWMQEVRSKPFARCHWCGTKVSGRRIHFDHVIALSRGGTHTIGNLCASCQECNLTKKNRLIADWICGGQQFLTL